jgi:hypothetical protein
MKNAFPILTVVITMLLTIHCRKQCLKNDRCYLAPDAGHCKAYFPKYYYDQTDKKCKEFIWGGCAGVVPFDSIQQCEKQCDCQ